MNVERILAFLPAAGAALFLALMVARIRRNRRQGREWYLLPNQVKAVGDLLPTLSGVLMGFTASITVYSLNIEFDAVNRVVVRFNVRNTAVALDLATFILMNISMVLALYIKSRSFYDAGFPDGHRFEETEFAREETRRTLEFLSSVTLLVYALGIACLLLALAVASSPYLNSALVDVIAWFPLFALIGAAPLVSRLFVTMPRMEGLATDVRIEAEGVGVPVEGRVAAWPSHPHHARQRWDGVLALFSQDDFAALRESYLRHSPLRIVPASEVLRHTHGRTDPAEHALPALNAPALSAYIETMDLPGRPLRLKLAGIGELPS